MMQLCHRMYRKKDIINKAIKYFRKAKSIKKKQL